MKYTNCKIIISFFDLVKTYSAITSLDILRKGSDLILSYDEDERKKYDLGRIWAPYGVEIAQEFDVSNEYDIFFCGAAKNRLEMIYEAYDYFTEKGLKNLFYVANISEKLIKPDKKITYNELLSYEENLKCVSKSRIILDIVQKDALGRSIRILEAIAFNKIYVTNNKSILDDPLYDPDFMFYFETIEDIDVEKIMNIGNVCYDYEKMDELKLEYLLKFIEKYFE